MKLIGKRQILFSGNFGFDLRFSSFGTPTLYFSFTNNPLLNVKIYQNKRYSLKNIVFDKIHETKFCSNDYPPELYSIGLGCVVGLSNSKNLSGLSNKAKLQNIDPVASLGVIPDLITESDNNVINNCINYQKSITYHLPGFKPSEDPLYTSINYIPPFYPLYPDSTLLILGGSSTINKRYNSYNNTMETSNTKSIAECSIPSFQFSFLQISFVCFSNLLPLLPVVYPDFSVRSALSFSATLEEYEP